MNTCIAFFNEDGGEICEHLMPLTGKCRFLLKDGVEHQCDDPSQQKFIFGNDNVEDNK